MQLPDALSRLFSVRQRDEILLDLQVDHIAFIDTRLAQVHKGTESCSVFTTFTGSCTVDGLPHADKYPE